ncbi:hypothetical protein D9Q98_005833 [Chlorella vulgaris]|uniref:Rhamnogalacturonase A/B/Epimerase-like pectate lyase domain-containing protein n=1 Tax=Chlorella vulgaris TaxID=3077 RepID=A0A9D4TWP3_CHLVU|nr:hypothetical protein D9Q98_005833 [Chlorella vulgaris]
MGCVSIRLGLLLALVGAAHAADGSLSAASFASAQFAAAQAGDDIVESAAAGANKPVEQIYLPKNRGMDWTFAGYREGKVRYFPYPPVAYNVRFQRFGAKGDGKTDDTAALQRAVAAANANPQGGVIYLPAGTYVLRKPLVITQTKVVLRGDGEGKTTIYIPVSLSDVFQGTWARSTSGAIFSQWSSGGAFINFEGKRQRSRTTKTFLGRIRGGQAVPRYSTVIPVSSTALFKAGQRIRIFVNDASTASRRRLLATPKAPAVAASATAGGASASAGGVKLSVKGPPAWVKQHPVYQAAVRGIASLGEPQDGLTPAQAAAADAQFAANNADSGVQASAAPGTIVAWLYGGNMVDSGPAAGVINPDEIQCHAVIKAVGAGTITLDRPLCFTFGAKWSSSIHLEQPTMQDSGVEKLTIRFKHTINMPHHGDKGYNALSISYATNFWVRNVTFINMDNGLLLNWCDRSTITDVKCGVTLPRVNSFHPDARNGHHALSITESHNNILRRFSMRNTYIHDVTVTSGSSMNVIMEGKGIDVNLDHHRTAPWANLFSDISLGAGRRPFASGGKKSRGAYSGLLNTYYNLRKRDGQPVRMPACSFGPLLNFVGRYTGGKCPSTAWYVAALPKGAPANLYWAQVAAKARKAGR